jgi:hypothetical protein
MYIHTYIHTYIRCEMCTHVGMCTESISAILNRLAYMWAFVLHHLLAAAHRMLDTARTRLHVYAHVQERCFEADKYIKQPDTHMHIIKLLHGYLCCMYATRMPETCNNDTRTHVVAGTLQGPCNTGNLVLRTCTKMPLLWVLTHFWCIMNSVHVCVRASCLYVCM